MVKILNAQQASQMLDINKNTIYQLAREGNIPCARVGNKYIFTEDSLEDWIRKQVDSHAQYITANQQNQK